jgi:hypothetical protein
VLKLIGSYLRSGVFEDGKVTVHTKGVPQGGPLSPLLSNIYLDALDKELETRGLSFCRYADDCNIYVGSEKAAERVFESVTTWIEKQLKLPVNYDKSDSGRPWDRQFLGYQPTQDGQLKPSPKSLEKLKNEVRQRFTGGASKAGQEHRDSWLKYITGWCNYFVLADVTYWRKEISGWIRRHIRKYFWQRWHGVEGRRNNLLRFGISRKQLARCPLYGSAWPMAKHPVMHTALNNARLKRYGFLVPSDFAAI